MYRVDCRSTTPKSKIFLQPERLAITERYFSTVYTYENNY
jgi:hypothetical protein